MVGLLLSYLCFQISSFVFYYFPCFSLKLCARPRWVWQNRDSKLPQVPPKKLLQPAKRPCCNIASLEKFRIGVVSFSVPLFCLDNYIKTFILWCSVLQNPLSSKDCVVASDLYENGDLLKKKDLYITRKCVWKTWINIKSWAAKSSQIRRNFSFMIEQSVYSSTRRFECFDKEMCAGGGNKM